MQTELVTKMTDYYQPNRGNLPSFELSNKQQPKKESLVHTFCEMVTVIDYDSANKTFYNIIHTVTTYIMDTWTMILIIHRHTKIDKNIFYSWTWTSAILFINVCLSFLWFHKNEHSTENRTCSCHVCYHDDIRLQANTYRNDSVQKSAAYAKICSILNEFVSSLIDRFSWFFPVFSCGMLCKSALWQMALYGTKKLLEQVTILTLG